jgi:peptidoglycan/xylan/chitin deacetylase (PgdA/CDA1 family)
MWSRSGPAVSWAGMTRLVLLSFDVEEFDIPEEYGQRIPEDAQLRVSAEGLSSVLGLLEGLEVRATFFTTAHFAHHQPELLRRIAARHEVASHGYYHSRFEEADLARSRAELERIAGTPVAGFRMARMARVEPRLLREAGYRYNSSENPIYLPGRYNNFFARRTAYEAEGILNVPVSATPLIRFPLFWLAFKNFPLPLVKAASAVTLRSDAYLNIYYHPWEFSQLGAYRLPWYVKRIDAAVMLDRLGGYLRFLKARARFATFAEFEVWFRERRPRH